MTELHGGLCGCDERIVTALFGPLPKCADRTDQHGRRPGLDEVQVQRFFLPRLQASHRHLPDGRLKGYAQQHHSLLQVSSIEMQQTCLFYNWIKESFLWIRNFNVFDQKCRSHHNWKNLLSFLVKLLKINFEKVVAIIRRNLIPLISHASYFWRSVFVFFPIRNADDVLFA